MNRKWITGAAVILAAMVVVCGMPCKAQDQLQSRSNDIQLLMFGLSGAPKLMVQTIMQQCTKFKMASL